MNKIKAIIFDIGGVLIENPNYKDFWKDKEGSKELRSQFGTEKISTEEFIKKGASLLNVDEKTFLQNYKKAYWTGKPLKENIEIFKKISLPKYLFSDTNPIHLQYWKKICPDIFELSSGSFLNKRKSEKEAFIEVIKEIGENPNNILFIDDRKDIIDVANMTGINTLLFYNTKNLIEDLKRFGVEV